MAFSQLPTFSLDIPPQLFIDRSTDGGATWGVDHLIGGGPTTKIGIHDYKDHELVMPASADCSLMRINQYPYIAASPTDPNTVYAVWSDGRWDRTFNQCEGASPHSDIAFSRTTDGGVTWSNPIRVNDDPQGNGIDQFFPGIGVRSNGTIGVSWYDRRYDPLHPYWFDLAYSQSTDGGVTWSPNQRVSNELSNPDTLYDNKGIDDVGTRKNLAFGDDYVLPGFLRSDPVDRLGDFYTDRGLLPPLPTSTATITPIPPSFTATPTRTATSIFTPTAAQPTSTATPGTTETATPSVVATATIAACDVVFTDVPPDSPFYSLIHCLTCREIVSGYDASPPCTTGVPCFLPGNNVTRGQMAKFVSNAAAYNDDVPANQQTFTDVPPSSTFWLYIERAYEHGVIGGYSDSPPCATGTPCFLPGNNVTRGQAAKFVSIAASYNDDVPPNQQTFTDAPPQSTFWIYVERVYLHGVISGYDTSPPCTTGAPCFLPGNDVTRGQTAKFISNAFFPNCAAPGR